jgi:prolyl-tRNA editing enzyme YbaK/EbsC (Cys-tRNA(Pro) deacylase)
MEDVLGRPAVLRVRGALDDAGIDSVIRVLDESSRTAAEAASALGVSVGQIASSLIFRLPGDLPLLIVTSGRHRVDPLLVSSQLGVEGLGRADADYVKAWSGFSIGGVSPLGWSSELSSGTNQVGFPQELTVLIDTALREYDEIWAAGGHPHAVFRTTFDELVLATAAREVRVAHD